MKRKKQALTLIEIMIVIVLIGLIGSVIGVNMKGSLDEGRAFKTRQAQAQIEDILMLEVAQGYSIDEVVARKGEFLSLSGLVKNPDDLLKDGWNESFEVKVGLSRDTIEVRSNRLEAYEQKKGDKLGKARKKKTQG